MIATFYLQVSTVAGRTLHSVGLTEESLTKPLAQFHWQRYKLTVEHERIVAVEMTDKHAAHPKVYTLRTHEGQTVPIYKGTLVLGAIWQHFNSKNKVLQDLIDLMDATLLVSDNS